MSTENQTDEQINLLDYSYPDGVMVEIPGRLLEGLIQVLKTVDENETTMGLINKYPVSHKEVFNKEIREDFLDTVKIEWKDYPNGDSFFNQEPQTIKSMLGAYSLDLLLQLKQGHLWNIQNGIAKRNGSFQVEQEGVELKTV